MSTAAVLAAALVLDALLGEPRWLWSRLPHPAVLMGRAIGAGEAWLNRSTARRAKGVLLIAGLGAGALALGALLSLAGPVVEVLVAAVLLAQRSLVQHVEAVADGLRTSLAEGRAAVAMIVGRDTAEMEGPAVARAAIESGAENLSDGVVAPAFWLLLGGLPGLLLYKLVNTADSMIGHRTPRYEAFGWAAARLDDGLNWIPARLTAGLIVLSHGSGWLDARLRRDARAHRSPNAGWPEAAMARVLGVALSGPRAYDGQMQELPWVNGAGRRSAGPADIDRAVAALWRVWGALLIGAFLLAVLD